MFTRKLLLRNGYFALALLGSCVRIALYIMSIYFNLRQLVDVQSNDFRTNNKSQHNSHSLALVCRGLWCPAGASGAEPGPSTSERGLHNRRWRRFESESLPLSSDKQGSSLVCRDANRGSRTPYPLDYHERSGWFYRFTVNPWLRIYD